MISATGFMISKQQAHDFHNDGVICLRQVIEVEWIDMLRKGLDKSMSEAGEFVWTYTDEADGRYFHNENRRWHGIGEYRDFIFNSSIGALVGELAGWKEASLLFDSTFFRTAGTSTRTPWHQDLPYLCVTGDNALVSAWIPLQAVDRSSTLECVRGSHRWGKSYYRLNFDPKGDEGHMAEDQAQAWDELPDIDSDRGSFDIIGHAMEPGDCLVIDGNMLHGSAGNQNQEDDLAVVTIRLLGENATYCPDKPGGVQPDLSHYAENIGLQPGDAMKSSVFPLVWSCGR